MLFNSATFALFFIGSLSVWLLLCNRLPKKSSWFAGNYSQKRLILVIYLISVSSIFYCFWNPAYLLLLVWIAFVDFWLALALGRIDTPLFRQLILAISLLNSLGILLFFKYGHFIAENWANVFGGSSLDVEFWSHWLLPVGISFYTFQSISYLVDVYRKELEPERKFSSYLLFLSFFPQLVAGPIVTAKSFLPQIRRPLPFLKTPVLFAVFLILLGLFKKMVIADHLAETSDFAFTHTADISTKALWIGMFSYSFQIYCDFSGYTDIAQGAALLFGFRLPENFKMPYLSSGFSEFWTRWHISLSQWLKKYVYISLGGNRVSQLFTYRNLFLVMAIGGFWHGASWNFFVWGASHGFLLILERWALVGSRVWNVAWMRPVRILITFLLVSFLWIFFRSSDFTSSLSYLQGLFTKKEGFSLPYTFEMTFVYCLFFILIGHVLGNLYFNDNKQLLGEFKKLENSLGKTAIFAVLTSISLVLIVLFSADSKPFVYFVF
ncbi:MBOAT family protein [Leptospira congkakensis]|uniref:MBOAT family protein n=1 Tax=Leptospira congkakensis TaxID=2484932 RepID=A0A4Z1A3D1_9LEPT|nr:MBOAT family O-acyltransferase [Leptospira congkakensis]TGL88325.1 MBOAT family protein [Leptospira congkakensis]TGL95430.1 MBOAT family protein [Leptospira congkakensis]TGL96512.1 MBOAT family protein [Leptospira congkakensis]